MYKLSLEQIIGIAKQEAKIHAQKENMSQVPEIKDINVIVDNGKVFLEIFFYFYGNVITKKAVMYPKDVGADSIKRVIFWT